MFKQFRNSKPFRISSLYPAKDKSQQCMSESVDDVYAYFILSTGYGEVRVIIQQMVS